MKKKNILLLSAYVGWICIALLYNKKNPTELQDELLRAKKQWDCKAKILLSNFLKIHQDIFYDVKTYFSKSENQQIIWEKKQELVALYNEYKEKAYNIYQEYSKKWVNYTQEWHEKLNKFYNEKIQELDDRVDVSKNFILDMKMKFTKYFNELQEKMKD